MTQTTAGETSHDGPKAASAPVIAQHEARLKALPFADTRDFDDAARGFLGTIENARVTSAQGRVVWSLEPTASCPRRKRPRPSTRACGGSRD